MERFNLKTWLEDKSRKIVTRDGKQARIICYDVKQGRRDDCYVPIIALIDKGEEIGEVSYYYSEDGSFLRSHNQTHNLDLFFVEDEDSMNEFETRIYNLIISDPHNYPSIKEIKEEAEILLELAKNEIDKSNPYSGISFEYNGHIWGMCARDNGVDILCDSQLIKHIEKQGEQEQDVRYKYLKDLITADDIHQMAVNDAMVQEAKSKAIDALSKLGVSVLLGLEKQGEQKPADNVNTYCQENCKGYRDTGGKCFADGECEAKKKAEQKTTWDKEDERILNKIQDHLREFYVDKKGYPYVAEPDSPEMMENDWLKSLKYRMQPLPKQEWSEEDEDMIEFIIAAIKMGDYYIQDELNRMTSWLKSIKPSHWKPREEQMEALDKAKNCPANYYDIRLGLQSLYNDLLKI